jgi:hypothetical protein
MRRGLCSEAPGRAPDKMLSILGPSNRPNIRIIRGCHCLIRSWCFLRLPVFFGVRLFKQDHLIA